jgi:sRNA-binding carbon storage regulator CsrA
MANTNTGRDLTTIRSWVVAKSLSEKGSLNTEHATVFRWLFREGRRWDIRASNGGVPRARGTRLELSTMLVIKRREGETTICVKDREVVYIIRVDGIKRDRILLSVFPANSAGPIQAAFVNAEFTPLPAAVELDCNTELSVGVPEVLMVKPMAIGEHLVRLGFQAPYDLQIHRREVWETIEKCRNL